MIGLRGCSIGGALLRNRTAPSHKHRCVVRQSLSRCTASCASHCLQRLHRQAPTHGSSLRLSAASGGAQASQDELPDADDDFDEDELLDGGLFGEEDEFELDEPSNEDFERLQGQRRLFWCKNHRLVQGGHGRQRQLLG